MRARCQVLLEAGGRARGVMTVSIRQKRRAYNHVTISSAIRAGTERKSSPTSTPTISWRHVRRPHVGRRPLDALRRMFPAGIQNPQAPVPGIQDMLERLRKRRSSSSSATNLARAGELKKKLDEGPPDRRAGIERQVQDRAIGRRSSSRSISCRPTGGAHQAAPGLQLHRSRGGAPLPGADEVAPAADDAAVHAGHEAVPPEQSPDDLRACAR